MTISQSRWLLGAILLLPGIIIGFSLSMLGSDGASADRMNNLPLTQAGLSEQLASSDSFVNYNEGISEPEVVVIEKISHANVSGQLVIQIQKYRTPINSDISARVKYTLESGQSLNDFGLSVWLTTEQESFISDVTPEWQRAGSSLIGEINVPVPLAFPSKLNLRTTLKYQGFAPDIATASFEIFEPKARVTGVSNPYEQEDDWVIPMDITVYEPGVLTLSALLKDDNGVLVTHLHSRQRLEETGQMLMHIRKALVSRQLEDKNLLLSDIQLRHISDRPSAPLGWGESVRLSYVVAPFRKSADSASND